MKFLIRPACHAARQGVHRLDFPTSVQIYRKYGHKVTGKLPVPKLFASSIPRRSLFIQTEETPNTDAIKFIPTGGGTSSSNMLILNEEEAKYPIREFTSLNVAKQHSPLATALLQIPGVSCVFLTPNFVTINKSSDISWQQVKPLVFACLMDFFGGVEGDPHSRMSVFHKNNKEGSAGNDKDDPTNSVKDTLAPLDTDDDVVHMIKELLSSRVRPVLQQDGGDLVYHGFRDGVVYLQLQGACRSCSSSTDTLKRGIENMLTHYIPQVSTVIQVPNPTDSISDAAFDQTLKSLGLN